MRISPGATSHSGLHLRLSVMVVNDLDYSDSGHLRLIDAAVFMLRHRVMVRFEDEARGSAEVEGILTGAVGG